MIAPFQLTLPPHSNPVVVAIVAQLPEQIETQAQQLQSSAREPEYARLKIQVLEEPLRLRHIARYGPGTIGEFVRLVHRFCVVNFFNGEPHFTELPSPGKGSLPTDCAHNTHNRTHTKEWVPGNSNKRPRTPIIE